MKEHPILFSAPMVRAILEGRKTQSRRIVKGSTGAKSLYAGERDALWVVERFGDAAQGLIRCPYGKPGDKLWVRESFRIETLLEDIPPSILVGSKDAVRYEADGFIRGTPIDDFGKLRTSIHMPRWASRLTLQVTGVRVERLQDISEADARAEGARCMDVVSGRECLDDTSRQGSYVSHYREIWKSINGAGSWDANAWVWVVEFRPMECK